MFYRAFCVLAVTVALAGCARHFAEQDDAKCQSFGARPGSREYYDCRMTMDTQRQAALRSAGASLSAAGARLGDKGQAAPNRSVSCSSRRVGSEIQTTCD